MFAISIGKYEQTALNFMIQTFTTSFFTFRWNVRSKTHIYKKSFNCITMWIRIVSVRSWRQFLNIILSLQIYEWIFRWQFLWTINYFTNARLLPSLGNWFSVTWIFYMGIMFRKDFIRRSLRKKNSLFLQSRKTQN